MSKSIYVYIDNQAIAVRQPAGSLSLSGCQNGSALERFWD